MKIPKNTLPSLRCFRTAMTWKTSSVRLWLSCPSKTDCPTLSTLSGVHDVHGPCWVPRRSQLVALLQNSGPALLESQVADLSDVRGKSRSLSLEGDNSVSLLSLFNYIYIYIYIHGYSLVKSPLQCFTIGYSLFKRFLRRFIRVALVS